MTLFQRGTFGAGHMQRTAEHRAALHARLAPQRDGHTIDVGTGRLECDQPRLPHDFIRCALHDQPAA